MRAASRARFTAVDLVNSATAGWGEATSAGAAGAPHSLTGSAPRTSRQCGKATRMSPDAGGVSWTASWAHLALSIAPLADRTRSGSATSTGMCSNMSRHRSMPSDHQLFRSDQLSAIATFACQISHLRRTDELIPPERASGLMRRPITNDLFLLELAAQCALEMLVAPCPILRLSRLRISIHLLKQK